MTTPERPPGAITPSARARPEDAGMPFDARGTARRLLREARSASLATLDPGSGYPLATLVNVATDADGAPLLLLSGLALHTRNLAADGRAALLLAAAGKGDALAHPRLTLVGCMRPFPDETARARFLERHPKAALYAALPDFGLWRFEAEAAHLNGGFARAAPLLPEEVLGPDAAR